MFGRGWGGWEPPKGRLFEKGDLKYVFLDLLAERPRHGYDLIRAMEERFQGRYTASPGTVYPILQMLEDMGYVTPEQQEGRKVYTVTEAGRRFLEERQAQVQEIWTRASHHFGSEPESWHGLMQEMGEFARLFGRGGRHVRATPEQLGRIRAILAQARREIAEVLSEGD